MGTERKAWKKEIVTQLGKSKKHPRTVKKNHRNRGGGGGGTLKKFQANQNLWVHPAGDPHGGEKGGKGEKRV